MDIINLIQQYAVIPVALICYLIAAYLKHAWPQFDNRWIPLVLLPVGIVSVLWLNEWAFTPETLLSGLCSPALAVYVHQAGKQTASIVTKGDG